MKSILFLYTGSDSTKAENLSDYIQGKLGTSVVVKSITSILAEDLDFKKELYRSDCFVFIGSCRASSLVRNKEQETEGGFITFDGKIIYDEFSQNKELVDKLVTVYFMERAENDWIPTGLNEKRIFDLKGQKIRRGNPALDHLEYTIRRVLGETILDW